jgi:sugar lactone lactonase YvrE
LGVTSLVIGILEGAIASADTYRVEVLVPPAPLHGANGMQFDRNGLLVGGSMTSGTIFTLDRKTGSVTTIVQAPKGIADDLSIAPDGTIAWTSPPMGTVSVLRPGGQPTLLYKDLPFINSIFYAPDGRLFAAQVSQSKGNLYELDPAGAKPPRLIVAGLDGLNGFEVTKDHILYGPLMYTGKILRIDLDSGSVREIASGFEHPTAVNLDSKGNLFVVDYYSGELTRIDPRTGRKRLVAKTAPPIDNLAISPDDLVYVSHPCDNGVEEINPRTGKVRQVAAGSIGWPGGGTLVTTDGREELLITGLLCNNYIDTTTGAVRRMPRQGETVWSGWLDRRGNTVVLSGFAFGEMQWLEADTGKPIRTLRGLNAPYGVKIMDDESVLLAEQGSGRILRYRPPFTGEPDVVASGLAGPLAFVLAGDELFVTEADGGSVSRVSLRDGSHSVVRNELRQPEGIARLPDGRLAIAEVGLRRLIAIPTTGGDPEVLVSDLPIGLPPFMGPPKTFLPTGVFVNAAGIIYLSSDVNHTVLRITH